MQQSQRCWDVDESSPSIETRKNWFNGRTSVFDEPYAGAYKTTTMEGYVTKIQDLELADRHRRFKVRELVETVGFSKDHVDHILYMKFEIYKRWWLSRLPTRDSKAQPYHWYHWYHFRTLFKRNSKEFPPRFVVVDEKWIHWYIPNKEPSKQWTSPGDERYRSVKYSHWFSRVPKCDPHPIPTEGQNGHRAALRWIIRPIRHQIEEYGYTWQRKIYLLFWLTPLHHRDQFVWTRSWTAVP